MLGLHPGVDPVVDRLRLPIGATAADQEVVRVSVHGQDGVAGLGRSMGGKDDIAAT